MVRARSTERGTAPAAKVAEPPARGTEPPSQPAPQGAEAEALVSVEKCINCRFYDRRHAKPLDGKAPLWGQCRRHAPRLNPVTAKAYVVEGIWPLVRDDDWCGEWKIILRAEEWLPEPAPAEDLPPIAPRARENERAEATPADD